MGDVIKFIKCTDQLSTSYLHNIYIDINELTNKIRMPYTKDGSLITLKKIKQIVKDFGLRIKYVEPDLITHDRARLDYEKKLIYVNKEINKKQQLFSIAHELGHHQDENFIKTFPDIQDLLNNNKKLFNSKVLLNTSKESITYVAREPQAAKQDADFTTQKTPNDIIIQYFSKYYFDPVKDIILATTGIEISEKTYNMLFKKNYYFETDNRYINFYSIICHEYYSLFRKFMANLITKIITEELVDYFAANLIIPTTCFLPLDLKPDREIASIFSVTENCVIKRRQEIENELRFLYPYKEYPVKKTRSILGGKVIGVGRFKIGIQKDYTYNNLLSFVNVKYSNKLYISTCINLRIDGSGGTKETAEKKMFENVLFFLGQNFKLLSHRDALKNLQSLYESDKISDKFWKPYEGMLKQIPVTRLKRPFKDPNKTVKYTSLPLNEKHYLPRCHVLYNISLKEST